MQVNARWSKKSGERHWHGGGALFLGAGALTMVPLCMGHSTLAAFLALSAAAAGIWGAHGPLMSWPAAFLHGSNAAAGAAWADAAWACRNLPEDVNFTVQKLAVQPFTSNCSQHA